jgi:hypothetical protein
VSRGVLLDPTTGRPEPGQEVGIGERERREAEILAIHEALKEPSPDYSQRPPGRMPWWLRNRLTRRLDPRRRKTLRAWGSEPDAFDRLPPHIRKRLARPGSPFEPRASGLGWEEVIYTPVNDGTAITAAAETILIPDFSIPAGYLTVGKVLKYTIMGRQSTAITTPGTITLRLRWGGVAGVVVVVSGAFAPDPTAAATNLTWMVEYWMQARTVGATGTAMGFGRVEWSDYDDASATSIVGNLNMRMAPTSAPAVATIDTTLDKLLSATYTETAATGSVQAHFAILEACN